MSKFFSSKYNNLIPYTPGEQPKDMKYIKLNTNESPFPPSEKVKNSVINCVDSLQLYPDPDCKELVKKIAEHFNVEPDEVIVTNGSDEVLNFAFMAYCDKDHPAVFPNITYGFYSVFAEINNVPYFEIPLTADFKIDVNDYCDINKTIFIANPNAPTGIALKPSQIEEILISNPNNVVIIDEAYVDFGADSCVDLIKKYNNLLVTQTFSKSRSMAGGRIGFGIGCKEIINDLNTVRYSTNPYNINRISMSAAISILEDEEYTEINCKTIASNREYTLVELKKLGFLVTESLANFVFAKHAEIGGEELYLKLKQRGILVRHFSKKEISQYIRITIGTLDQMKALLNAVKLILEEKNENISN